MEKIANKLKEQREKLGLSIEDVSKKTRLTIKHIKALENGDLAFFNDDLAYLRFFIKSYCNAVQLDFEEVKDDLRQSIDDYTTSSILSNEVKKDEIKRNIDKHKPLTKVGNVNESTGSALIEKGKKVDGSKLTMGLAFVAILIIFGLSITFLMKDGNKNNEVADNNDSIQEQIPLAPSDQDTTNKEDTSNEDVSDEVVIQKKEMEILKDDVCDYTINYLNEGDVLVIESTFNGSNSGYSVTVNGKDIMQNQIYQIGQTSKSEITVKKGTKISLWFGCMVEVNIKVNGKVVKTDDSINPSVWPGTCPTAILTFTIGETYESAQ